MAAAEGGGAPVILLARRDRSNAVLDWNVDGCFNTADIFVFIRDIMAGVKNLLFTSLSSIQLSQEEKSVYTSRELLEMNEKGMDGL